MKKITLESNLEVYDSVDELPETIQDLMSKAHQARNKAYAPYSRFKVGASVLLEGGIIVSGNNQENAAFPSGLCAERVAVFSAGAQYPNVTILAMALVAGSTEHDNSDPIPPCGACRQSLVEYEVKQDSPISLYFMGKTGKVVKSESIKNLLPLIFDSSYL